MSLPTFTADELKEYNGKDGKPIYISLKGVVYDCSSGRSYYGEGEDHEVFAAKEVTRSLAKMLFDNCEANASWSNLNDAHQKKLDEWVTKFSSKYPVVGAFKPDAQFEERGNAFDP